MVKRNKPEDYHKLLDSLVSKTWLCLATDLLSDYPLYSSAWRTTHAMQGVPGVRKFEYPGYMGLPAYEFKKFYQVQHFAKRWIFLKDVKTSQQLEKEAEADFIASQATFRYAPVNGTSLQVVERASSIISRILGPFSWDNLVERGKWGKRAAKGLPALLAYLDVRTSKVTGTRFQIAALNYARLGDKLLNESILSERVCDAVDVTFVPKSFKSMRCIAPDTIAGGFLSQGLGCLIEESLRTRTHIDIRSAQHRHRILALKASRTGRYTTMDLRKASDSFTWEHIKALVPKDWLAPCLVCRTPYYGINGSKHKLRTYMLMGSGHTFPMQTLLFYAILEAIRELSGTSGRVYVYGDDCIYPSRMHRYVSHVFPDLGLTMNPDKTFSAGPFRESCGGDYHSGIDVRPAMPESPDHPIKDRQDYLAEVHNVLNGLLTRWSYDEIPTTAKLLYDALAAEGKVRRGLRGVHDTHSSVLFDLPASWPVVGGWTKYEDGIMTLCHKVLRLRPSKRRVKERIEPYFWTYMRHMLHGEPYMGPWDKNDCDVTSELSLPNEQGRVNVRWYKWEVTETCLPSGWTEEYLLSRQEKGKVV